MAEATGSTNPQLLLVQARFAAYMKCKGSLCRFDAAMSKRPDYREEAISMVDTGFSSWSPRWEFPPYWWKLDSLH